MHNYLYVNLNFMAFLMASDISTQNCVSFNLVFNDSEHWRYLRSIYFTIIVRIRL